MKNKVKLIIKLKENKKSIVCSLINNAIIVNNDQGFIDAKAKFILNMQERINLAKNLTYEEFKGISK